MASSSSSSDQRIICLIDMDCFYVQCEQRNQPQYLNTPCAVAQYNKWQGGGLIAVDYLSRPYGVKRGMRGDEASKKCPELHIFTVPERNGKADLNRYREASAEVFEAIGQYIRTLEDEVKGQQLIILERASVDEAFIDFTQFIDRKPLVLPDVKDLDAFNTKLILSDTPLTDWIKQIQEGDSFDECHLRLIMGALLVGQLRKHIYERTQFKCSAGISHNKMLAKLACGVNKPNAQTIFPINGVQGHFRNLDISEVRSLGGKLGHRLKETFAISTMGQISQIPLSILKESLGPKTAEWLHGLSNGYDQESVMERRISKSIGCGKNFPGKNSLNTISDLKHWVKVLCEELYDRLESDKSANKRMAKLITVGYSTSSKGHCSKAVPLIIHNGTYPKPDEMTDEIMKAVFTNDHFEPVLHLSLVGSKFIEEEASNQTSKIDIYFKKVARNERTDEGTHLTKDELNNNNNNKPIEPEIPTNEDDSEEGDSENDEDETESEDDDEEDEDEEMEAEDESEDKEWIVPELTAERIEELGKSFFVQKILTLYNLEEEDLTDMEFDEDSDDSDECEINSVEKVIEPNGVSDAETEIDPVTDPIEDNECKELNNSLSKCDK